MRNNNQIDKWLEDLENDYPIIYNVFRYCIIILLLVALVKGFMF